MKFEENPPNIVLTILLGLIASWFEGPKFTKIQCGYSDLGIHSGHNGTGPMTITMKITENKYDYNYIKKDVSFL